MPDPLTKRETGYGLAAYVSDVSSLVARDRGAQETVAGVEECNRRLLSGGFVMPDELRRIDDSAPYSRNLVHQDPDNRFAVIAIVWGAFQETTVHDHLNWCVMSTLENRCVSVEYERLDDESDPAFADLRVRHAEIVEPGAVIGLTPPPRTNIHKISNAGRDVAITLHTYGDPGTRARVFDPVTGRVEVRELEFHHVWKP